MDDLFGFLDPDEPKTYTPPAGYEGVHKPGMSWAQQGQSYPTTSRVSSKQWNHLIAQMRGLGTVEDIDVSDVQLSSPLLLRTFIVRAIIALLDGTVIDADGLAPLVSPTFSGVPTAPTASQATNNTQIATTAFVKAAINALVTGAPGALDTLDELAAALGDDPNFSTTVLTALANRVRADAAQTFTAAQQAQARNNISAALKGQITGLILSNNSSDATNDIDISAGEAASTETNPVLMALASTLTKRLDASWSAGSGNGGLDTGSIANTTYHIWLIQRSDTGVVDALFSTSATSPTMPANYDRKRRIGSIVRSGATIVPFLQRGDKFTLVTPIASVSVTNASGAVTRTLDVPLGILVDAIVMLASNGATSTQYTWLSDLAQASFTPTGAQFMQVATGSGTESTIVTIGTNTSGQIRSTSAHSGAGTSNSLVLTTVGWIDRRGRDGGL